MIKKPIDHREAIEYIRALVSYVSGIVTIPYSEREPLIDHLLDVEWKLTKLDSEESEEEEFKEGRETPWNG